MKSSYIRLHFTVDRIWQMLLIFALLTGPWLAGTSGADETVQSGKLSPAKPARVAGLAAPDLHTTALWLFDDPPYANVTLTDAGPYQIDLRLETGREKPLPKTMIDRSRGLVPGKFGRALHLPVGEGTGVSWPENSARNYGTTYLSYRGDEVPERCNLGYIDFTLEFWFKASGTQANPGVIWEVRNEEMDRPGVKNCPRGFNSILLDSGRTRFLLISKVFSIRSGYLAARDHSLELPITTDAAKLSNGDWHHLAFTFTARERQMRHYVDGRLQPLPEKGTFLPQMGQIISMRIGRDLDGKQELEGLLDEMRISDIVRYKADFTPPASFSRNYGAQAPAKGVPNGPPLLFSGSVSVYRYYTSKYPGAPDAYLAFPWRYVRDVNIRPGSFMMTSRDGVNWKIYEPPYYFSAGGKLNGRTILEALMEPGMIQRGDEIWQYGTVRFTEHGGALYGGVEHEGGYFDSLLRLVQRLDGFVSLDAGATKGSATTRPLIFEGNGLTLNVAARGSARVALRDESGKALPGFSLEDCDPIRVDSVRHVVTWKGRSDVTALAGKPVRLQFELTNAKLYAFQFK